jgi:hypothetical protein
MQELFIKKQLYKEQASSIVSTLIRAYVIFFIHSRVRHIVDSQSPSALIYQAFSRSILVTLSVCLEWAKKMSHPSGIPLVVGCISEIVVIRNVLLILIE